MVSAAVGLVSAEAAGRIYYWYNNDTSPFVTAPELIHVYYPELKQATGGGETPRVLLLGASVLNRTFGDVAPLLGEALEQAWSEKVRIVSLAMLGHSSLDSYYKYRELHDERFDLVVIYHGINDLRANNVPPQLWRDDYGHYAWYDEINFYFQHETLRGLPVIVPYALKHAATLLRSNRYVPEHGPNAEWVVYGEEIKTAAVLRANLERILALALDRNDPVLLMTFAHFLPEDYTLERFQRGEMGFGHWDHSSPSAVEIWGAPDNVRKGLQEHDRVLRELHQAHPGALFVDQTARLGGDPGNFVDVCHFSPAGAQRFVEGIMEAVQARGLVPRVAAPGED